MYRCAGLLLFLVMLSACGTPPVQTAHVAPASRTDPAASPTRIVPRAMIAVPTAQPTVTPTLEGGWVQFVEKDKGFRVLMPRRPILETQNFDTPAGRIKYYLYAVELENGAYRIGYNTFPEDIIAEEGPAGFLARAQAGTLQNFEARLIREEEISLNGIPGRAFIAEGQGPGKLRTKLPPGATIHVRIFLLGNQFFEVNAISGSDTLPAADIDRFLNSFELIQPKKRS